MCCKEVVAVVDLWILLLHIFIKLLIPLRRKDGNPFNTTVPPSSAPASPPFPLSEAPVPSSNGPSNSSNLPVKNEGNSTTRVFVYATIVLASLILGVLVVIVCISKWRKKQKDEEVPEVQKGKRHERLMGPMSNANLIVPNKGGKFVRHFVISLWFFFLLINHG